MDRAVAVAAVAVAVATEAAAATASIVRAARRAPHPRDRGFSTRSPVDQWRPVEWSGGTAQGDGGSFIYGRTRTRAQTRVRAYTHIREHAHERQSRAPLRSATTTRRRRRRRRGDSRGHAVTSTNDDILLVGRCRTVATAVGERRGGTYSPDNHTTTMRTRRIIIIIHLCHLQREYHPAAVAAARHRRFRRFGCVRRAQRDRLSSLESSRCYSARRRVCVCYITR